MPQIQTNMSIEARPEIEGVMIVRDPRGFVKMDQDLSRYDPAVQKVIVANMPAKQREELGV